MKDSAKKMITPIHVVGKTLGFVVEHNPHLLDRIEGIKSETKINNLVDQQNESKNNIDNLKSSLSNIEKKKWKNT